MGNRTAWSFGGVSEPGGGLVGVAGSVWSSPLSQSDAAGSRGRTLCLRRDDLLQQETDGQVVLLDLRTSTYLLVNETGTVLLPLLLRGADRTELLDVLLETFDVAADRAEADLEVFLAELRGLDLVG